MIDETFRTLSTGASWSGNERNHLFLGTGKEDAFLRLSGISGLDDPGDSMSASLLDFDRDGWMDVALGNISKPRFRLLHNRVRQRQRDGANHFVALRLVGGNESSRPRRGFSPRDAIGARVELELDNARHIVREHRYHDGFKAQHSSTMLVGIGNSRRVAKLHVVWPSGRKQSVADVVAGSLVTLYEDALHSPTGRAAVRETYRREPAGAEASALRLEHVHGERGLTIYTTMSTACGSCARSLPDLRALREAFNEEALTLVGIPVDPSDTIATLQSYVAAKNPAYAPAIGLPEEDLARVRRAVATHLHGKGDSTPASIVTDPSGRILAARWGVPTLSEVRRLRAGAGIGARQTGPNR